MGPPGHLRTPNTTPRHHDATLRRCQGALNAERFSLWPGEIDARTPEISAPLRRLLLRSPCAYDVLVGRQRGGREPSFVRTTAGPWSARPAEGALPSSLAVRSAPTAAPPPFRRRRRRRRPPHSGRRPNRRRPSASASRPPSSSTPCRRGPGEPCRPRNRSCRPSVIMGGGWSSSRHGRRRRVRALLLGKRGRAFQVPVRRRG